MARLSDGLVGRVAALIAREHLLAPGQDVVALVSGGADSTLLLVVLVELGYGVEAVHCAHGLRGAESEADAAACALLAARVGVPFTRLAAPVPAGSDLERRARDARRAVVADHATGRTVATGHTRDDRLETILYRLATSPGNAAFAALPASDGAGRVRPLLELGRDEVRDALREAGIGWREDSSNADRRFARNRVRLDLLPAFRSLHPAADANLLATAAALVADAEALSAAAAGLLTRDGRALDVARAAAAPPALARAAVRLLAGPPAPTAVALARVLGLLTSTAGSARAPLGAGRVAERRYGELVVVADEPGSPPDSVALAVPGRTPFGAFVVDVRGGGEGVGLDPTLAAGLLLRRPQPGERIVGRRSTVARMLLEAKVPQALRPHVPVVDSAGVAVCIPGLAVSRAHARPRGLILSLEPAAR